jgi:hypothetical protein
MFLVLSRLKEAAGTAVLWQKTRNCAQLSSEKLSELSLRNPDGATAGELCLPQH